MSLTTPHKDLSAPEDRVPLRRGPPRDLSITRPPTPQARRCGAGDAEARQRLLGNGLCGRPLELDCRYETICESCTVFITVERRPTIEAQREDATAKGQTRRAEVDETLLISRPKA